MMISVANPSGRNTAPRPVGRYGRVQPRIGVFMKPPGSSVKRATVVRAEAPDTEGGVLKFINSLSSAITNSPFNQFKIKLAELQAGSYDADAIKGKVEECIANNKVMVFSWSSCPFCTKAKSVLDDMGVQYTALELDTMGAEGAAYRAELAKKTSRTSMPNIFIEGKGIGGCNDGPGLLTLKNNGELEPMLRAAEAM